MKQKQSFIQFLGLVALAVNAQLGSGMFMLPGQIAPFGAYSVVGWILAGLGAIILSMGFGFLIRNTPQKSEGGTGEMVSQNLGKSAGFLVSWSYWFVSWFSSIAVVVTAVGGISGLHPALQKIPSFYLEAFLIFLTIILNLQSKDFMEKWNFAFVLMKVVPLVVLPVVGLFHWNPELFEWPVLENPTIDMVNLVSLLFWGFIGLEIVTNESPSSQGSGERNNKTLLRALIVGTAVVALIYLLNTFVLIGSLSTEVLMSSRSVYGDFVSKFIGEKWSILVNLLIFLVCLSSYNAWARAVGQISLQGAESGVLPRFFKEKNKSGIAKWGIILPNLLCICISFFMQNKSFSEKISLFIASSVTIYLWVYLFAMVALLVGVWQKKKIEPNFSGGMPLLTAIVGMIFCAAMIGCAGLYPMLISLSVPALGVFLRIFWKKDKNA